METRGKDEVEIDFRELMFILLDRAKAIVLTGVLFALAAFLITEFLVTPKYESTASFYIISRQDENQLTSSDMSVSTSLTADAEVLVVGRTVLEQVIEEVGLDKTADELLKQISVNNPPNTRILEITVTDEDALRAKQIADAIAEVSAERIVSLMGMEQVNIIEYGNIADEPASPNLMKNIIIGGVAGILLAIVIVVLIFVFSDTYCTPEDAEQYLDVSVLGVIPKSKLKSSDGKNRKPNANSSSGQSM